MGKVKIIPNYKREVSGVEYWKVFNAGRDHERKIAIQYFINRLQELKQVKGVGEQTFKNIMEFINEEWDN